MTTLDTPATLTPGSRLPLADGTLAVLVGIPGCGKSTFAAQYPASWRVCLDEYRLAATDDFSVKFSVLSPSRCQAGSRPRRVERR